MLAVRPVFDPWSASAEDALLARAAHSPGSGQVDPLSQYDAAQLVTGMRATCLADGGGCTVLQAVRLCMVNRLVAPQWLADAFLSRHSAVTEARVGSWDEPQAFGRYWPERTRLAVERRRLQLRKIVHAAVWELVASNIGRKVTRDLFEEIGERHGVNASGATVEALYYGCLAEGMPNPLDLRAGTSEGAKAANPDKVAKV